MAHYGQYILARLYVCLSQMQREESLRQESALKQDSVVVARGSERIDPTGTIKQTASGRIEMRVTNNFSIVMDEEMLNNVQRQRQKLLVVEPAT